MKSPLRILKRMFCCFLVVVLVLETSGLLEVNSYAIDGMDISNVLISNINETPSSEEWLNSNEVKDIVTNEIDSTDDDLPNQETDSRGDGQLPESHEDESGDNEDNSDIIDDVTGEEKEDISEVIEEDSEEGIDDSETTDEELGEEETEDIEKLDDTEIHDANNIGRLKEGNYSLTYSTSSDGNSVTIIGFEGELPSVLIIPDSIDGKSVLCIGAKAFMQSSIEKVVLSNGIEEIKEKAFYGCANLKEISLSNNLTVIGVQAFAGDVCLEEILIPDEVTNIQKGAFGKCTSLSTLKLSNKINTIAAEAFYGCDSLESVKIPQSLKKTTEETFSVFTSAMNLYGPFYGCINLKNVTFEDGITTIADGLFANCPGIEEITIPDTVTTIGKKSFYNCANLREVQIDSAVISSIGNQAFSNCPNVKFTCGNYSGGAIYLVDNNMEFTISNYDYPDAGVVDYNKTVFTMDKETYSYSGAVNISADIILDDTKVNSVSKMAVVFFVPRGTQMQEGTVICNGKSITDYKYDANTRRLSVPITEDCIISYNTKVSDEANLICYAFVEYTKGESKGQDVLGVIDDDYGHISLLAPQQSSSETVEIHGVSTPESKVDIFVNEEKQLTLTAKKNGSYSGTATIDNSHNYATSVISAQTENAEGNVIKAEKAVVYRAGVPFVKAFDIEFVNEHGRESVSLLNSNGIKPRVYWAPQKPLKFTVDIENDETIEEVYITSTKGKQKKSMVATYNPETGKYVAEGFFDDINHNYVPGDLAIEYSETNEKAYVSDNVECADALRNILGDTLDKVDVDTKYENGELETVIDWHNFADDGVKATVKGIFKEYDKDSYETIQSIKANLGIAESAMDYLLPGYNDEKYILNLDFSNPDEVVMLLHDASDTGLSIADQAISVKLDLSEMNMSTGTDTYQKLFDWSERISTVSTAVDFLYGTYGIYDDYYDLVSEIDKSPYIENKYKAKEQALELRDNQVAFLAMMTALPLLVAASPMTAPAAAFSAILAMIQGSSAFFWSARIAKIKGQSFSLRWVIDPSGYITDSETEEPIQGAFVYAYWIPYDNTDDFYDRVPSDDEYGALWDALEYEQANPLSSNIDGKYAWDVPEGWWRIKCEKEGYYSQWSDWMTVPPIQLDVNFALNRIPEDPEDGLWIEGISEDGFAYEGTPLKPDVKVYDGSVQLKAGTDYTISYKNNTNAYTPLDDKDTKAPTITVTGKGNYAGKETKVFIIVPRDITDEGIVVTPVATVIANGKVQKPVPVLTFNKKKLANNKDFKIVSYKNESGEPVFECKEPGKYFIEIEGIKNFTGTLEIPFEISGKERTLISKVTLSKIASVEYTGEEIIPDIKLTNSKKVPLVESIDGGVTGDYVVTYGDNHTEIGTHSVTITGINDYCGTRIATFSITGRKISAAKIDGVPKTETFTGNPIKPTISLTYTTGKGATAVTDSLLEDTDYTVEYTNNTNPGTATITITGIGHYTGTVKKTFKIVNKAISNEDSALSISFDEKDIVMGSGSADVPSIAYTKGGAKPGITVTFTYVDSDGETVNEKLTEKTDYTVKYSNNTAITTDATAKLPTITVTGKGRFKGTKTRTFKIVPQDLSAEDTGIIMSAPDKVASSKKGAWVSTPIITDKDGKKLAAGKDYDKNLSYVVLNPDGTDGEDVTATAKQITLSAGTYVKVTARAIETTNPAKPSCYTGSISTTYRIVGTDISKANISVKAKTYTGKAIKLDKSDITVKVGKETLPADNYEIIESTYKNNINKGKATVTIRGIGDCGGEKIITFTIGSKSFLWWWRNLLQ